MAGRYFFPVSGRISLEFKEAGVGFSSTCSKLMEGVPDLYTFSPTMPPTGLMSSLLKSVVGVTDLDGANDVSLLEKSVSCVCELKLLVLRLWSFVRCFLFQHFINSAMTTTASRKHTTNVTVTDIPMAEAKFELAVLCVLGTAEKAK